MVGCFVSLWLSAVAGASPWPDLGRAPQGGTAAGRKDAAVLVGIEDYVHLSDVPGAAQTVGEWEQWLSRTRGLASSHIHVLTDKNANATAIRAAVDAASAEVQAGGRVWLVFVGHTSLTATGADAVLWGVDTPRTGAPGQGVLRSELAARLATGAASASVWVVDSVQGPPVDGASGTWPTSVLPTVTEMVLVSNDRRLLAGERRSGFSYLVLGGMRGWADAQNDGKVHSDEAVDYSRWVLQQGTMAGGALPAHQGPPLMLADFAREVAPDVASLASLELPVADLAPPSGLEGSAERFAQSAHQTVKKELSKRAQRKRAHTLESMAPRVLRDGLLPVAPPAESSAGKRPPAGEPGDEDPLAKPDFAAGTPRPVQERVLGYWRGCVSLADAAGCADLGYRVEHGADGVQASRAHAAALYQRGCDHGHGLSCANLGVVLEQGIQGAPDLPAARLRYQQACTLGWGASCGDVGVMLAAGEGGAIDLPASVAALERGCDLDDGASCRILGQRAEEGARGVLQDAERAAALLEKACRLQETDACPVQTMAGDFAVAPVEDITPLAFAGNVSPEQRLDADSLWQACVADSDADACNRLGYHHEMAENGLVEDIRRAAALYRRACALGSGTACGNIGYLLEGDRLGAADVAAAQRAYARGCSLESGRSCTNLGMLWEDGTSLGLDLGKAAELYVKGCALGTAGACNNLGYLYEVGRGVGSDIQVAIGHYLQACQQGSALGCGNAGYLLWTGPKRLQDHRFARGLLSKACDDGVGRSCNNLALMLTEGDGGAVDLKESVIVLEQGCSLGDANACRNMAWRYFEGSLGRKRDRDLARTYFVRACEAGNTGACQDIERLY